MNDRDDRSNPTLRSVAARIARSFYFAFQGMAHLFRTQRNARIEAGLGIGACILGAWLRITRVEWCIVVLTIACVLILEGLNTAIEAIVDLASPNFHPLAKTAKDVAAATVLIAAIASVIIGCIIFGPRLLLLLR
jgi:diacylglycerol kinase (ATP)